MKLLWDTHIWIWYGLGDEKLPENMKAAIAEPKNQLWISPISLWEVLLLAEKGRIVLEPSPTDWMTNTLKLLDVFEAPLNGAIAILSRQIDCPHKDPADRFIAATVIHYGLTLVTVDRSLASTSFLRTFNG